MATKKATKKAPSSKTVLAELQQDVQNIKDYLDYLADSINKNAGASNELSDKLSEVAETLSATVEANRVWRGHQNNISNATRERLTQVENVVFASEEPSRWQRVKDWFADRFPGLSA